MDENSISQISRPGTSLRTALNSSHQNSVPNSSQSIRPVTQSGRPITGIIRPGNLIIYLFLEILIIVNIFFNV